MPRPLDEGYAVAAPPRQPAPPRTAQPAPPRTSGSDSASTSSRGRVTLNVYDVSESGIVTGLNKFLRLAGTGAYHAAVEIYDAEWSFGFTEDDGTGVFGCEPKGCEVHHYKESIDMGTTKMTEAEVDDLLDELSDTWPGQSYDLLRQNCCHFSDCMAQRLGVGPIPKWVLNLAGAGAKVDDSLAKGKELRGAAPDDAYKFGDLTRGTLEKVRLRGKKARGQPPTASTHFGDFYRGLIGPGKPQPGVVWVDFSLKAFAHLNKERSIDFRGFHDDDKSDDYEGPDRWLDYISQRLKDDERRVKVVICNRRHLEHVPTVQKTCKEAGLVPPKFVVVTRRPEGGSADVNVEPPKIEGADFVIFDWAEAAKITLAEVKVA